MKKNNQSTSPSISKHAAAKDSKKKIGIIIGISVGILALSAIAYYMFINHSNLSPIVLEDNLAQVERRKQYSILEIEITNYIINHNGDFPPEGTLDITKLPMYNSQTTALNDPSGVPYSVVLVECISSSPNCGVPTVLKAGEVYVVTAASCSENNSLISSRSKRAFAVWGYLTGKTGVYCTSSN